MKNKLLSIFLILGLIGIVGLPETKFVRRVGALEGNGKTASMVEMLSRDYLYGDMKVITNFNTRIPESEVMSVKTMVKKFANKSLGRHIAIGLDEIGTILSSMGEKKSRIDFYSMLLNQARKGDVKIYYTIQRQMELIKPLRERTTIMLVPEKYHYDDNSLCYYSNCERHHYIKLFKVKPSPYKLICIIDCEKVGQLYDTDEIIEHEEIEEEDIEAILGDKA